MAEKYEVTKAWHGVAVGDVVELEKLNPVLKSHVRRLSGKASAEQTPSTPEAGADAKARKEAIAARLAELGIEFDKRKSADDLSALLPEGEIGKLFPED